MKRVLAIDLGGGSGRGIVFSYENGLLQASEVHRFQNAPIFENGTWRWNLQYLFCEVKNALRAAEEKNLAVTSLSIDTWGVDYALVGLDGKILENPYCYRDSRTDGMTEYFPPVDNKDLYRLTGISLNAFNTSYQLYADSLKRDFSTVSRLLFMPNAVGYLLTGVAATEPCIASTSAFYAKDKGFLPEFFNKIDVPFSILPEVRTTGSVLGAVKAEILAELHISHPVTVLLGAGHDTACAVMSIPTEEKNPLFLSSGTWSLLGAELDGTIVTDTSFAENYTNELGYANTVRFLKNIMGFWLLQECRKKWAETEEISSDDVAKRCQTAPAFRAFINVGDPTFNPPGDMPQRIQKYIASNYGIELTSVAEIARAMFESLALEYRYALEGLVKITKKEYTALYIVGGGSRNDFMNQITADSLGITVYAGPAEATAIGNAVGQLIALGEMKDLAAGRKIIKTTEKVKTFTPTANRAPWNEAYKKYLLLKK